MVFSKRNQCKLENFIGHFGSSMQQKGLEVILYCCGAEKNISVHLFPFADAVEGTEGRRQCVIYCTPGSKT